MALFGAFRRSGRWQFRCFREYLEVRADLSGGRTASKGEQAIMKRRFIGALAVAFAVSGVGSVSMAAAQDRTSNGNTTGTSAPRGGDSGGGAVSRGGDSGGSSSGSSGSSSSGGSGSMGSSPVSAPSSWSSSEAPRRADEGQRSRGSGSPTGDRAVLRNGGGSRSSSGSSPSASSGASGEPRAGVPTYSRPRDGRPVTGTAVERGSVPPAGGGGGGIYYPVYPYYPYYGWGFWGAGYGYGLGYLYYDPWYGGGFGGYGWGDPYAYTGGGGTGGYAVSNSYKESGGLRLKIDPKQAQIYVDGYYVGVVDSFDGAFQKLSLDSGSHKIELKAEGFEPLQFEVLITPGETSTYKGDMKRIK